MPPMGPSPLTMMVMISASPFMVMPIMAAPVSRRPRAAVAAGLVLWMLLACSTRSLVVAAKARTRSPAAVALTI